MSRLTPWVLWALIAAEWIVIFAFPAYARFFGGHGGWLLGLLTGWLWRDSRAGNKIGGSAVERVMAAQARELKRRARLARFFRRR